MTCLRTCFQGCIILFSLLAVSSCKKEIIHVPSPGIGHLSHQFATDWNSLALDLIPKCNGFTEPIAARSLYWGNIGLYEALHKGFDGYSSLDGRINGCNANLPKPDPSLEYNWIIVASSCLEIVYNGMYQASGSQNLASVVALKNKWIAQYSAGISEETKLRSIELGKEMGWKLIDYSATDGQEDAYLHTDNANYVLPIGEGKWIPTSPDYNQQVMLPNWGQTRLALLESKNIQPRTQVIFSTQPTSLMYSEAYEIYTKNSQLTDDEKSQIDYWTRYMDSRASPLFHNVSLLKQILSDNQLDLTKATEAYLRMSILMHDGYIISWQKKFASNLLRPSSYIKQNIDRYFIPDISCLPVPEYFSESALLYRASAELLSTYFGYRTSFMDYTQINRADLRESRRHFNSFYDMAKEAAYTDILAAVHFRSSIDAGFEAGFDLGQTVIKLNLK